VIAHTASALAARSRLRWPTAFNSGVLSVLAAVLWALRHQYAGISSDAQLYAFAALAHLHPALATDLSLQNTSQGDYTLFTPLYAAVIDLAGVRPAALALWIPCSLGALIAAWFVVRTLASREIAVASVAALAATIGSYGAATVFRYDEDYFTARSVAEVLVLIALACHLRGRRFLGFGLAAGALTIHPLMALPGVLLLLCLSVPSRLALAGAIAGVLATLLFACAPLLVPRLGTVITVMDPAWAAIVRERSQFLFLQLWSLPDWELNARPFLALGLSYAVLEDRLVRKLSLAALLVGGAGLSVALIASTIAPVAILLQGQAWRWVWIATLVCVLLLVPTGARLWKDQQCGALCTVLWLAAWCFGGSVALICLAGLVVIWTWRAQLAARLGPLLHWSAAAGAIAILIWTIVQASRIVLGPAPGSPFGHPAMQRLRAIFDLGVPSVILILLALGVTTWSRRAWIPAAFGVCLLACLIAILPSSFPQRSRVGLPEQIQEFDDWRSVIPPTGTVYVPAFKDSGAFVWLTLGRPAYLSTDQSAGVVFSRRTALEIQRRSDVLLPVEDPDWKIMTRLARMRDKDGKRPADWRPLTAQSLVQICRDPLLGFVAAIQNVGFEPVHHAVPGAWNDWNLYDCDRVRAAGTKR
jgi:hypothetical protein